MYSLKIIIYSNNVEKLNSFVSSFKKHKKRFKIKNSLNVLFMKARTSRFSVLTSPHVHKTAQEQFKLSNINLHISTTNLLHLESILLLFKYYNKYYVELKFKFVFVIKKDINFNKQETLLIPNNFILNNNCLNNTLKYLKIFELYGINKKKK